MSVSMVSYLIGKNSRIISYCQYKIALLKAYYVNQSTTHMKHLITLWTNITGGIYVPKVWGGRGPPKLQNLLKSALPATFSYNKTYIALIDSYAYEISKWKQHSVQNARVEVQVFANISAAKRAH